MNKDNLVAVRQAVAHRFLSESQSELRSLFAVMKMVAKMKADGGDPVEIARQSEIVNILWEAVVGPLESLP